jgi:hypothetical protein
MNPTHTIPPPGSRAPGVVALHQMAEPLRAISGPPIELAGKLVHPDARPTAAEFDGGLRAGCDLRVGVNAVYRSALVLSLIARLDDGALIAGEALAAGRQLGTAAATAAIIALADTPEAAATAAAQAGLDEGRDRVAEARADLARLQDQYNRTLADGVKPSGQRAVIDEAGDWVRACERVAQTARDRYTQAAAAQDRRASELWRSHADGKLAELQARRTALTGRAEEFARTAAAELITIDAAEKLLKRDRPPT